MAWFDRIFGNPGSSSSYRYSEGDEYPAYSRVPWSSSYGGWNGPNIFEEPTRRGSYSPERPFYRPYDTMPSYDYDDRPSYHNTNNYPTYARERASSPYDPAITEANDRAIALALSEEDEYRRGYKYPSINDTDEELARAMQESLDLYQGPRISQSPIFRPPVLGGMPGNASGACAGCKRPLGYGRYLNCIGKNWHPDCFRCKTCNKPITEREFSVAGGEPHHRGCFKDSYHPKCAVCQQFIPPNANGLIEYRSNPFWKQNYCPRHERDGTPRCCSCERLETRDSQYAPLPDGRKICSECVQTSVVDTRDGQPLYREILKFYKNSGMMIDQEIPMLLVDHSALNEARQTEKGGVHTSETRGLCLSEEQIIPSIVGGRPRFVSGPFPMWTEPQRLIRHCEVTAILVLHGLPRLLTGSILAHELMHAWLRLEGGFPNLSAAVEEGICQVMSHIWTSAELKKMRSKGSSGGKGVTPEQIRFGEFILHNIAHDASPIYGEGFRRGLHP